MTTYIRWFATFILVTLGVAAKAGSVATYVLPSGIQAVVFTDTNRHLDQVYWSGSAWVYNDLTAATNAPLVAPGTSLAAYVLPSGIQAVAFTDDIQHLDQVYWSGSAWVYNDLTAGAGTPVVASGTSLAAYVLPSGIQAVVFTDQNQHLGQVSFAGGWFYNDLTYYANAPVVAPGTSIATYVLPSGIQAIAFTDQNQHLGQVSYAGGAWFYNDLTYYANAPALAPGTNIAAYVLPSGIQAIVFTDQNQHLGQVSYSGVWFYNDLTTYASAPLVAPGTSLATYVLPSGIQAVAFTDTNQHLDQVFYASNTWFFNDLTAQANAPVVAPGSSIAAYVLPSGIQAVAFVDENQHLSQVFYSGGWLYNDLTASAGAPPEAELSVTISGSQGIPLNGASTYTVNLSSNQPVSLFALGTGAGAASFSNGSSSISISSSANIPVFGRATSGTAGDVELVALSRSNAILARVYVSVVSIQVTARMSGQFSADDTAAQSYIRSGQISNQLGPQITIQSFVPLCAVVFEYVGTVSPSNYPGKVVLRRSLNDNIFSNQTLVQQLSGDDTSLPSARVDTPTSAGHVYDIDGPGVSPIPGDSVTIARFRANFAEYAVLDSSSNANLASNVIGVYGRTSCQGTYGTNAVFKNDVPNDNIAGSGTTPLTWNLQ